MKTILPIGFVLDGKYKILSIVGRGGMSVVYLAINERANKTWAVKEVRKQEGRMGVIASSGLIAEMEMLRKLRHPNLPEIVDVIDREDSLLIVMDYIEGQTLLSVLECGVQDAENVIDWGRQLCDVLSYLHEQNPPIIYRDMKPSNVMLRPDGRVVLIDFGTAREYKQDHQNDTTWLGTRGYAAPEQFGGGGQTDARTDIYCLGATMYHLLTGLSPADTQFVIHPIGRIRSALADSGIEKIILKCCAPDPVNRYQDCRQLMHALEHVHDQDRAVVQESKRKWRMFLAAALVLSVGLAGTIGFSVTKQLAVNNSYETRISLAENAGQISDAADYYLQAIDLRPGREEAFFGLLDAISTDGIMTPEEKELLERNLYKSHQTGSGEYTNIELFKQKNEAGYADFMYDLGFAYYNFDSGGKKMANACFSEIRDWEILDGRKRRIADIMFTITDYYVNLDRQRFWTEGDVENQYSYAQFWQKLDETAQDLSEAAEDTGSRVHAIALYREIATQVTNNLGKYAGEGVSKEDIVTVLDAAGRYLDASRKAEDSTLQTEGLIRQADTALREAYDTVSAYYKKIGEES